MLGEAAAMLVAFATSVAAQITQLFGVALDEVRAFAGPSIPVLVLLRCFILARNILDSVLLLFGIGGSRWTEVGVHAGSGSH